MGDCHPANAQRRVTQLATHAAAIRAVELLARAVQAPFARQQPAVPELTELVRREIDYYTWFMFQAL
jgi:hypothetical protein